MGTRLHREVEKLRGEVSQTGITETQPRTEGTCEKTAQVGTVKAREGSKYT